MKLPELLLSRISLFFVAAALSVAAAPTTTAWSSPPSTANGSDKMRILVSQAVYLDTALASRVTRYAQDVWKGTGRSLMLDVFNGSSVAELKSLIYSYSQAGVTEVALVGDLPKPMCEDFSQGFIPRDVFQCDMYLMTYGTYNPVSGIDTGWTDVGRKWWGIAKTETVSTIDFEWGIGAPLGLPVEQFAIRYEGSITAPVTGSYQIAVYSDNGRSLQLKLPTNSSYSNCIDQWNDTYDILYSCTISLNQGDVVPFVLKYYEQTGGAYVHLQWKEPSATGFTTIPDASLSDIQATYYNNIWMQEDPAVMGTPAFADNHIFDGIAATKAWRTDLAKVRPAFVAVSRIDPSASSAYGSPSLILQKYFDKDHRYWSNAMGLGSRGVIAFGEGSVDNTDTRRIRDYLNNLFDPTAVLYRVGANSTSASYLSDLQDSTVGVSIYNGHGYERGLGITNGLEDFQLAGIPIQPLLLDLESCSALRTIKQDAAHPDGDSILPNFIGGAHLYADAGNGRSLVVKGASKTSGGDQREGYFYTALKDTVSVGYAFRAWAKNRLLDPNDPIDRDSVGVYSYFFPQMLIGDLFIVPRKIPDANAVIPDPAPTPDPSATIHIGSVLTPVELHKFHADLLGRRHE